MARVGVKCERGQMTDEECAKCATNPLHPCGIPAPILAMMRTGNTAEVNDDTEPGDDAFTPSRLLRCFRAPVLQQLEDWYLDVHHSWAMVRGTLLHAGMEQAPWPGAVDVFREKRLRTSVDTHYGPQVFQGKPDAVVLMEFIRRRKEPSRAIIEVWDWKTTEFGHDLTAPYTEHQLQVWMYAWLLTRTPEQWLGKNAEVVIRSVNIAYLASGNTRIFSTLGPNLTRGKIIRGTKPREYEPLPLAQIPTAKSMGGIETFIRQRIEAKIRATRTLPRALEGEDAKWCFRCPVYGACIRRGTDEQPVEQEPNAA